MGIVDLYRTGESRKNLAHFAALASLAAVNGEFGSNEKHLMDHFAHKLHITDEEYKEVMKKENKYPVEPYQNEKDRFERLYDFFRLVFADSVIEDGEMVLVKNYALGMGFPSNKVDGIIEKSVAIFSGKIDFESYLHLIGK